MAEKTTISWTATPQADGTEIEGATWNPVVGCSHVSAGCEHCYAESLALRWGWTGNELGPDGKALPQRPWTAPNADHNVVLKPQRLRDPYRWKEPRRIFVNSLSDVFHPLVPFEFVDEMFTVMRDTPRHTYMILTKRPERAAAYSAGLEGQVEMASEDAVAAARGEAAIRTDWGWPNNVWMGASIESNRHVDRADHLRRVRCKVRFLSCEPLLGPLPDLDLRGIHWVIVGGESGSHYRPMDPAWARDIRATCRACGVAFFYKQGSGRRPGLDAALPEPDGTQTVHHEWPTV